MNMTWIAKTENDRFAFKVDQLNPDACEGFSFGLISGRGLKLGIFSDRVHAGEKSSLIEFQTLRDILPGDLVCLEVCAGNFYVFLNWRRILTVKLGSCENWVSAFIEKKDHLTLFSQMEFSKPGNLKSKVTFGSSDSEFQVEAPVIIGKIACMQ